MTARLDGGEAPARGDAGGSTPRILTIPNALSILRLVGVPVFLVLVFTRHDGWALLVLMVAGVTDWLDGKLARSLGQESRLGQLLDPAADRLYILATLIGLTAREIIPVWLTAAIVARELVMAAVLAVSRHFGHPTLPVHFLGKAATFNLLYAFPLLLLGDGDSRLAGLADVFGWAFAIWGVALYWWSAVLYAVQVRQLAGSTRAEPA